MTKLLLLSLLAAAAPAAPAPAPAPAPASAPGKVLNRVAATVNGDVVTLRELEQRGGLALERVQAMPPGPERDRARAEVLRAAFDQIVSERLFDAQAKALGVEVLDPEVDSAIEEIKKRNSLDEPRLEEALAQQGMTRESFRKSVKRDIESMRILQVKVRSRVKVTDEDVKAYWQSHPQEFQAGEEVRVRHVFLAVPPGATSDEDAKVKARAERLLARARAGEDFAALARAESEGPSAKEGGELGWLKRGQIQADLERAAFGLPQGGISGLVHTRAGWQFLQVVERRGGGLRPFEEVKEEIRNRLVNDQAEGYRTQFVAELKKDATIDVRMPELKEAAPAKPAAPAPTAGAKS